MALRRGGNLRGIFKGHMERAEERRGELIVAGVAVHNCIPIMSSKAAWVKKKKKDKTKIFFFKP